MLDFFKGTKSKQEIGQDFLRKLDQCGVSLDVDLSGDKQKEKEAMRQRKEDKKVMNEGGNFEVQVHIQRLKDLMGVDWGGTSDPVVTVTILDQKKSTKKVTKKTNITLNQNLFFSLKALEPRQLIYTKCAVEVFDHEYIFPNKLIGSFEFNLGSIYYKKHHELYNQWVALTNNQMQEQNNYDSSEDSDGDSDIDSDRKYDDDSDTIDKKQVRGNGIQGSLKLTIRVLGANDEQHIHTEAEKEASKSGKVLLPSSLTQTAWKLTIRIYAYKHFAKLDEDVWDFMERINHDMDYYDNKSKHLNLNASKLSSMLQALVPDALTEDKERKEKKDRRLDPFFIVKFGNIEMKSTDFKGIKVCKGCHKDNVNIQFELPVMEPTHCEFIQIEFHDEDISDSDLIGVIRMNYRQIMQQRFKAVGPRWYHIYGSAVGEDTDPHAVKMNKAITDGTYFRGQCLIDLELKKEGRNTPKRRDVVTFKPEPKKVNDLFENYELCCDIYRGTEMYNVSKEMYIEIAFGGNRAHIDKKQMQRVAYEEDDDRETWNIHQKVKLIMEDIPRDKEWKQDMLHPYFIFVYLCVGKKEDPEEERTRVAYHRIHLKDIFGVKTDEPPQWYDMREDLVLNEYDDGQFPGSLLMTFYCKKSKSVARDPEIINLPKDKKANTKTMYLRGDIYLGKNLPSTDILSQCDAYLQMRFCGKTLKTQVCDDRSDPEWWESLQMEVEVPQPLKYAPDIYCEIFDKNTRKDTALGRFTMKANKISSDNQNEAKEYELKHPENDNSVCGIILARFELSTKKMKNKTIEKPRNVPHSVHIVVLGLRDLNSVLGVHDCHIVFELEGQKYKSRTSNEPDPRNPNFCEIIRFDVDLPENELFLPNFNIYVQDSLFGGLIERTIGYASESVRELRRTEAQRNKFLSQHEKTLRNVQPRTPSSSYEVKEDTIVYMKEGGENETEKQTKKSIEMSKKQEDKKKKDEFVYFEEDQTVPESEEKPLKWMMAEDGQKRVVKRDIHDDELEDILQKHEGDFPLNPFLDIPLYSIGKNKRNIGAFKGLISFAPNKSMLLEIEIYDCKDLRLNLEKDHFLKLCRGHDDKKEDHDHDHAHDSHPILPYVVVKFDKTELRSSQQKGANAKFKQKFEIPVIEPLFVDNDEVSITVWNKTEDNKKGKHYDHIIGIATCKYSEIAEDNEINGWLQLKHHQSDKVVPGQIYAAIKVINTVKLQKARVMNLAEPQYTNIRKSKSYQEAKTVKLKSEEENDDLKIGSFNYAMQYIRQITRPQQLYLRLYVLNGIDLTPTDGGRELNDPYLTITIGEQEQTTKFVDDTKLFSKVHKVKKDLLQRSKVSPDFYEAFEFAISMPGASSLKIECWDSIIYGIKDNLIGSTTIDIEDRWYDPYWKDCVEPKPIETRTLKLHQMPHGKLKLWLEILTVAEKKKQPNMIDISQPQKDPYELRLIIWETTDVPVHDYDMNDLFCKASLDTGEYEQQTDLHFRSEAAWVWNPCKKGPQTTDGSFNWRMKFPIDCLAKRVDEQAEIHIDVWDQDYFSASDAIGTAIIPLTDFLKFCHAKARKNRCIYKRGSKQKIEFDIKKRESKQGKVKVTMELVPYKLIKKYPAGIGRGEPNANPKLPDPTGRKMLSMWHPFRSIKMLIGKKACCKLSCLSVSATIIYALISFFPQLFTEILVENMFDFKEA